MSLWLVSEDLLLEDLGEMKENYPEDYEDLTTTALLREVALDPMVILGLDTDTITRRISSLGFSSVIARRFKDRVIAARASVLDLFRAQNKWVRVVIVRVECKGGRGGGVDDEEDEEKENVGETILESYETVLPLALLFCMHPRLGIEGLGTSGITTHGMTIYRITQTKAESILLFFCGAMDDEESRHSHMTNHIEELQRDFVRATPEQTIVIKIVE